MMCNTYIIFFYIILIIQLSNMQSYLFSLSYKYKYCSKCLKLTRVTRVTRQMQFNRRFLSNNHINTIKEIKTIDYTVENLPEETIYILDGTSMLYNAYFSKESILYSEVQLSLELSTSITNYINSFYISNDKSSFIPENPLLPAGALVTLISQFVRFIRDVKPRYLIACFDAGKKNFRHELYPLYKQQRPPTPSSLLSQLILAPIILDALGVTCLQQENFEADDVMATMGLWAKSRGLNVVHVSDDKDMMQLVTNGIHIYKPKSKKLIGIDQVIELYGVLPHQLQDFQALMGDSADNIPGIKGIGPKTACALLKYFHNIDNLYESLGLLSNKEISKQQNMNSLELLTFALQGVRASPKKILMNLQECQYKDIQLYKQLVSLNMNVNISSIIDDSLFEYSSSFTIENKLRDKQMEIQDNYREFIKQLSCIDNGQYALKNMIGYILYDTTKYSLSSNRVNSLYFRYIGEKLHCEKLFELLHRDSFIPTLNKLRIHYHTLDRQLF